MGEGVTPLNINLPVSIKVELLKQAQAKGISMTALIIQWVEENKKPEATVK